VRVIEGSQLEEAGLGIHADFEALEDGGAYDSIGPGSEAASGNLDEAFFEGQVSKGHRARQGDSRFACAGIAEAGQAGRDYGFQGEVAGGAGIEEDTARTGIEEEAEGLAAVDAGRNPVSGRR
jgi:hypothetical protein